MKLHLIAAGTRLPEWLNTGYKEYARRLPPECPLTLTEISLARRGKGHDPARAQQAEGRRMLDAVPKAATVVALDRTGKTPTTRELADRLGGWLQDGRDVALLVGGPDGLDEACLSRADLRLSLSLLTLPHGLVRIVVAEQLYRAWSLLSNHPYHRP